MIKLELRNVKEHRTLSQETPAYTATLYLDGRKVADVSNHGHGGCDLVHWHDRAAEAVINAHFAALPPRRVLDMDLDENLELWCHEQVDEQALLRDVKRKLKRTIFAVHNGREVSFKGDVARLPVFRHQIEAKYPGIVILNGLDDATLLTALRPLVQ